MMDTLLKIIVFKVNLIQVANFKMAAEIEPPFCFCVINHLMRVYKFRGYGSERKQMAALYLRFATCSVIRNGNNVFLKLNVKNVKLSISVLIAKHGCIRNYANHAENC